MTAWTSSSPRKPGRSKKVISTIAGLRTNNQRISRKKDAEWTAAAKERANEVYADLTAIHKGKTTLQTVMQRKLNEKRRAYRNTRLTQEMNNDLDISFGGFGDANNDFQSGSESEVEDDDWIEDGEELVERIHNQVQRQELLRNLARSQGPNVVKRNVGMVRKKELANWNKLVAVLTGRAMLESKINFCSCKKTEVELLAISLMDCELVKFEVCDNDCPFQAGKLGFISKGYYPSSPIRPRFAVHVKVLELFYIMSQTGPSSKFVYATGLQNVLQKDTKLKIPNLYRRFLQIYSAYMDVVAIMDTKVKLLVGGSAANDNSMTQPLQSEAEEFLIDKDSIEINNASTTQDQSFTIDGRSIVVTDQTLSAPSSTNTDYDPLQDEIIRHSISKLSTSNLNRINGRIELLWPDDVHPWNLDEAFECLRSQLPLSLLCPRCFGNDPKPQTAFVSVDGNFQHKRFPTSEKGDNKYLEDQDRRLFIAVNHIDSTQHCIPDSAMKQTGCERHFKAASEKDVSKHVIDTGLMAIVCRCGVPLRLYNVRGTGERAVYALRLVQSVLSDESCPPELIFSYDINCVFSKYAQKHLLEEELQRMKFSIGIFHCYAHQMKCQILFNPRMIKNAGMADGESPERVWSKSRHLISALRVASSRTRISSLTHLNIFIGEQQSRNFPSTLRSAFRYMIDKYQEVQQGVQAYCATNGSTIEDLQRQADSMREYFLKSASSQAQLEDDICEYLMAIEDMELFEEACSEVKKICGTEWMEMKLQIALRTNGRINQGLENDVKALRNKVKELLLQANQTMDDWVKDGDRMPLHKGVNTLLYEERRQRVHLSSLRRLNRDIKQELISRKLELDRLHCSSTLGSKESAARIRSIQSRTKKADKMIKEYNKMLARLPASPLNPHPFPKNLCINDSLFEDAMLWELDRIESDEKWAHDQSTRRAIALLQEIDRIKEELEILVDQGLRFVNWHYINLKNIRQAIGAVAIRSQLGDWLRQYGQKSANILSSMISKMDLELLQNSKLYTEELLTLIRETLIKGHMEAIDWNEIMQAHFGDSAPSVQEFNAPELSLEDIGEEVYAEIAMDVATAADFEGSNSLIDIEEFQ